MIKINMLKIILLLFIVCLNVQVNAHIRNTSKISHVEKEASTNITLLISDGGNYAQVIQCNDTTLKHGYARVYPDEKLDDLDFEWYDSIEYKGKFYPVEERILDDKERQVVNRIIKNLRHCTYVDPNEVKDDYQYIIYLNDCRVISTFAFSLKRGDLPKLISNGILDLLSIPSNLYPNFWLVN